VAFADNSIVLDQLTPELGIGGMDAFQSEFNFEGLPIDLAPFLSIDGQYLKTLGVTGAKSYKYGTNWAHGSGLSRLNVVALAIPAFKNWEVRDSAKIRMSGTPNGEPYSFGNQWLEWGQRIGIPSTEWMTDESLFVRNGMRNPLKDAGRESVLNEPFQAVNLPRFSFLYFSLSSTCLLCAWRLLCVSTGLYTPHTQPAILRRDATSASSARATSTFVEQL